MERELDLKETGDLDEPAFSNWVEQEASHCSRRDFLQMSVGAALFPWRAALAARHGVLVNDCHSQLNPTMVSEVHFPTTIDAARKLVVRAGNHSRSLSICGARHAAGGQQFLSDGILLDMTKLKGVRHLDSEAGLVTVEGGAIWSDVQAALEQIQSKSPQPWGINQKQTGLNTLTIGGTIGANAHGQGLMLKPFVEDVESLRLIGSDGDIVDCSARRNPELFALVVGGYGIFGIVCDATLRLVPRQKVKRLVQLVDNQQLGKCVADSIGKGFRYGHYQLNINEQASGYLQEGIYSTYEPVDSSTPITGRHKTMERDRWLEIIELVHRDKQSAYESYVKFYESTDGSVNWADIWQNNYYRLDYHKRLGNAQEATEVLSEIYVPLERLPEFLTQAREHLLAHGCNIIYSTVRFIDKDDITYLPWARQRYACVIFNFHTVHSKEEIDRTMNAWSYLIDRAIAIDGSFYLTYQHVADKKQLLSCYPKFQSYLEMKLKYDPHETFQSDWYRWHKRLLS